MVVASPQSRKEKYMELIKGKIDITLSVEDVTRINSLIERDTARPIRKSIWDYEGKSYTSFKCPTCDSGVSATDGFCKVCGQRLDTENTELGGE